MVSISKVKSGISRFVEEEICTQMDTTHKFLVATGAAVLVAKLEGIVSNLPLGLVEGEMMDIDIIYEQARKNMEKPIPVKIPMVGTLTFDKDNLDTLYNMITGA